MPTSMRHNRPSGGKGFPPYVCSRVFDLVIIGKTLAVVWRDQNAY
ncbi:MAG: hypothetical protein Q8S10_10985 [Thiobacillus sp.]|nr:hypothetical protein [Thiobacillus sp.]